MHVMHRKISVLFLVVIFLLVILILPVTLTGRQLLANPEYLRTLVDDHAILSGSIFVILYSAHIAFPFIPGQALTVFGGYAFGPILGFFLSLTGFVLGSILVFFAARVYGERAIQHLLVHHELDHFEAFMKKK